MKKLISFICLALTMAACKKSTSFLDNQDTSTVSEEMVFTDSLRSIQFLVRIYNDVGFSFNKGRWDSHGNLEQATDEAEYQYSGSTQKAVMLYSGIINPGNFIDDFWSLPYANIRRCNLLLSKVDGMPLSAGRRESMAAEARFLRAFYYEYLLKNFGGIPLIGDKVFGIDDVINLPRNTYEECVDYLVKELDETAALLPLVRRDEDYGRVTKGACLALKARILLYAASPLFNGGANTTDAELAKIVSYPTATPAHWARAAAAAKAVIDLNYYSLYKDNITAPGYGFYRLFLLRNNTEYIFARHQAPNRTFEGHYLPSSRGGGSNSDATQNIVDDFPMKNGQPAFIYPGGVKTPNTAAGYNPASPYANRDPRFAYTIIYNGAQFFLAASNSKQPVNIHYQRNANGTLTLVGDAANNTTGYYVRKMLDDNTNGNTERGWPLIRYAEVLLNYAEAINETGNTAEAYRIMKEIRDRAGIDKGTADMYGMEANMTTAQMRDLIRNERRLELAYEDHRYFDVRRWKIAMVTQNGYNKVVQVIRETNGTFTYVYGESIRKHNFRPEMYLLPIPQPEISKMPAMVQNPGW